MAGRRQRAEVERLRSELEESRPYLGLARQLHDKIEQTVADPADDLDELAEAIEQWPRDVRLAAVRAAFRELPAPERWDVLTRLFDDDELRDALAAERQLALDEARRAGGRAAVLAAVRERRALDTRTIPAGEDLTLGLFRESDGRAAVARGSASTASARRLVLRATDQPGRLIVVEDVFNPAHGLFVTPDYDEAAWRAERLEPHAVVAVGAAGAGAALEPVVYPGGRFDVEVAGVIRRGRLHVGYATLGEVDLFVPSLTEGDRLT